MQPQRDYDGIPVCLRYSDVEHERAGYATEWQALELARTKGWRCALETLYDAAMVRYATSAKRLAFLDLVPIGKEKEARALEIGTGFGQHTVAFAGRVAQLDTLEVRLVNALFARLRCDQEGVRNVSFTCGGDDCRLPFPDETYDAVTLNLVLEWCSAGNRDEPAPLGQQRLLSEIRRVLKPGGVAQVSTKNRFSYRLLTGRRDEHSHNLPFGSALPRWLLRGLLRVLNKPPAPGYLYSYPGLARALAKIGFSPVASYWAVPEMRFPDRFIPTDAQSIRMERHFLTRQGESRSTDLLMRLTPASFVKYVMPGLFFIVRRS